MLRELMEANHDGHNKKLSDDHMKTIFDAVAHDESDMDRIKEMAAELGDSEDYDRTPGGAYFAMMRMYICVHGTPPDGKIVGNWWKQVPPGFVAFAEDNGIHNAHENVIRAGGIAEHTLHKQKEAKGEERAAKKQEVVDAQKAKSDEKAKKAHGKNVLTAQQTFKDRWPTIKATISPPAVRKEVEAAKQEIFHDIATGMSIHAAVAKVVTQHGGIMESAKPTFVNFLIEGTGTRAKNAAQAQENLNQAVIKGVSTAAALQDMASFVGAKKAQMYLDNARKAVAEKNDRKG